MKCDILIIGGGVIGCAVARELSAFNTETVLIERAVDVAEGASKANSGIVHAGFDAKPGSQKARFNVEGGHMFEAYCKELGAPFVRSGAMVLAFEQEQRAVLEKLLAQGTVNGVDGLSIIERDEILALEPSTNPEVICALLAKTSALASPYELTFALADHAAVNGVTFMRNTEAQMIAATDTGFTVHTNNGVIETKLLVNCAGLCSAMLHNQISERKYNITPRKGEYYLLDRVSKPVFGHTMFQVPGKMGKGVLVSPTGHNTLLIGPSAQDVQDNLDVSTTAEALSSIKQKALLTWPAENLRTVITTFSGIRAHEEKDDFIVGATQGVQGAYEAIGIESPGLTAAPAIAKALCEQIAADNALEPKKEWLPPPKRSPAFLHMTMEQRQQAYADDANYGNIVCRCEQVTEAEIRQAIRRPVGARTVDGIKRRVRAGMGRCQGGFCSPRVVEILAEELGISPFQVTLTSGNSQVLVGSIGDVAVKGDI